MITRDDLPETPDWLPESRDGAWAKVDITDAPGMWDCELRLHADPPAHEAQPLTWDGDNA